MPVSMEDHASGSVDDATGTRVTTGRPVSMEDHASGAVDDATAGDDTTT